MIPEYDMLSRWGVQIEGSAVDLAKVRVLLNGAVRSADSHFVFMYGATPVLGTNRWDHLPDFPDVRAASHVELAIIRGCAELVAGCGDLRVGTVYDFSNPATPKLWRVSDSVNVKEPDTREVDPAGFAEIVSKVRAHEGVHQAILTIKADPSWIDIYRGYEAMKALFGGEHRLFKQYPHEKRALERLRMTANSYRHFDNKSFITEPMGQADAINLLRSFLIRGIDQFSTLPYLGPPTFNVKMTDYDVEEGAITALNDLVISQADQNTIPASMR